MNRSHPSEARTALASRLKAATLGFGITVAPLAIVALVQFALMPQIVGSYERLTPSEQAEAISFLRRDWLIVHAVAAALFAIYWLLTALFGKGQLLRLRAANKTLALSLLALFALSPFAAFFPRPDDLKGALGGVCPFLGISDEYTNPYAFDAQTNCDAFFHGAHTITGLGLMGLSVVLLVVSVIVRIVSSRLARSADE
jgi:hypothetical protein